MAADDDRRAVAGPPAWPPRAAPLSGWFIFTGAVLIVSLLAAFFVQARQYALLSDAARGHDDYLALNLFPLETEYLRLRERWHLAAHEPATARTELQLRYDIFVSRISLLQTERAEQLLAGVPQYGAALRALGDFVDRADSYLGPQAHAAFSGAALLSLQTALDQLDEPVHQMLLAGALRTTAQVNARNASIVRHNRIGLALTVFLSLLLAAFGFLALRRMRQLDDSHRAMEAMANRLHDAREQAQRASQAKSEFLTSMSHAIRTPFHGMLGMLTLLRDSKLDARQQEQLRTAIDSADHLLSLLNDIVDLSKLEAGRLALDPQQVDLALLVYEVQRLMRAPAAAKGLQLTVEVASTLPPRLLLDGTRVRQVLYNLVANAIRFTNHGGVQIQVRTLAEPAPALMIDVADSGVGMDDATVRRLFERSRLPGAAPAERPQSALRGATPRSTGLGLEIAHRLLQLMGGTITVDSAPGRGSTFHVRLPLQAAAAQAPAPPLAGATAEVPTPARPRRVLVAEDNAVNRLVLGALLDRMGHRAHFVENGLEALQATQQHDFDLVLMDVHMPVMDGITATEAIRRSSDGAGSRVPIVALTADAYADTRERCLRAGMDDVLVKPLGAPELQALFRSRFGADAVPQREAPTEPRSAASQALLDTEVLARLVELMPRNEAAGLYRALLTQASDAGERMRQAARQADSAELQRIAHGVKGAALNLGLHALAAAADQLGTSGDASAGLVALALQRFDEALNTTRARCESEPVLAGAGRPEN